MSLVADLEHLAGRLAADVEGFVKEGVEKLERHVEEHPQPLFALLRRLQPVLVIHGVAIVTRYDDVVAVLEDDRSFGVEPYGVKMRALTGEFILGLNDSPRYEHDVTLLRQAAPRSDTPALAGFARETAEALVAEGVAAGRIDVVEVSKRLPAQLMARWFGTPGPSEDEMIVWTMAMFEDIFVNLKNDPDVHARAKQCAGEMVPYVEGCVAERKRGSAPADGEDVLGRLIAQQSSESEAFSDAEIATNLIGLIVGFIPTVATATSLAIDALLDRPEALVGAQAAARDDDEEGVRAHMWEAMRLAPQAPGLLRKARVEATIAAGTDRAKQVPAGTTVLAATESAMLDDSAVEDPEEFRLSRPAKDYLHFGAGLHECFGRFANEMQIPAIASALLSVPGLSRAPGDEGRLTREGPYPKSLLLTGSATAG